MDFRRAITLFALAVPACISGEVTGEPAPAFEGVDPGRPDQPGAFPSTPGGPPGAAVTFTCDPAAPPVATPLRRLTSLQHRNSIRDLVTYLVGPDTAKAVLDRGEVVTALALVPGDERRKIPQDLHGSFRRLDQELDQTHVDGFYEAATAIGAALTEPTRMPGLLGPCASDADPGNDDGCITDLVERFGALALRRPLTPEDVAFYKGYYRGGTGIDPAGVADVIAGILLSPGFLYLVEDAGEPAAAQDRLTVSPHELAARLSYHFWQSTPDRALLEAATSGALGSEAGFRAQVSRLFADPRTRATLDQFYLEAWKLEDVAALDARLGDPTYRAFAGADLPTRALRDAMLEEVLELARHHAWRSPGGLDTLFSSDLMLSPNPLLAPIYGVAPHAGGAPARFAPGQRPGLFTRAAFLVNGTASTRPVMKGLFLRKEILCDPIVPPPDNVNPTPPELDRRRSTRQVIEALTEQPGSACAGCHQTYLNPLGFLTEGYDALGRARTEERLFDGAGNEVGRVPVETRAVPQVVAGDTTVAEGPADLARLIARSGKAQACFARQYFRFTFGRWEDDRADGCTLERLRAALARGTMADMFKEAAFAPQFRQRSLP